MNTKSFVGVLAAVALLVGSLIYGINHAADKVSGKLNAGLGGTVNYSNSLSQANLYATLESLLSDITNTRAVVSGVDNALTASLDFPVLATSTAGSATSTVVTGLVAGLGDAILVFPSTQTASTTFTGYVTTASTTSATVTIIGQTVGSAAVVAVDPAATTFTVIRLSSSTFTTPAALNTASSTSN